MINISRPRAAQFLFANSGGGFALAGALLAASLCLLAARCAACLEPCGRLAWRRWGATPTEADGGGGEAMGLPPLPARERDDGPPGVFREGGGGGCRARPRLQRHWRTTRRNC